MKTRGLIGAWVLGLGLAIVLLWALGAGVPPAAGAGVVIIVDSTADELNIDNNCTLREAIQAANTDTEVDNCPAGDGADTIVLGEETYLLSITGAVGVDENFNQSGDLDIRDVLTITGAGPTLTLIDANGIDRALDVDSSAGTAFISGLTILNGVSTHSGGGIETFAADLTLVDVVVRDCSAPVYGGGVHSGNATTVLSGTQVLSNTAQYGGGVQAYGGTMLLINGKIFNNSDADYGGGLHLNQGAEVTVEGTEIFSNTADRGGGINVVGATLTVNEGLIRDNEANDNGAGLYIYGDGSATLAGGELMGNVAVWSGGGVFVSAGSAILTAGQISGNEANSGAGVYVSQPSAFFTQTGTSTIMHNTAATSGGGIYVNEGSAWLLGGTVYSNTAQSTDTLHGAGGLMVRYGSTLLDGGEIRENVAHHGAGVYVLDTDAVFTQTNGLVTGNVADAKGGGLYLRSGAAVLEGGSVSHNSAGAGGGIYSFHGRAALAGGLIHHNSATVEGGGVLVYQDPAWLDMQSGQITRNTSIGDGGGLYVDSGTATLEGGKISGNNAGGHGGGAFVEVGTAVLTQTGGTIELNDASRGGGGVYIDLGHAFLAGGIVDNDATLGGGVYLRAGSLAIDQGHVLYNESSSGGGIYNSGGTASIVNSTISRNSATDMGGGLFADKGSLVITYTTIADNGAGRDQGQGIHFKITPPMVVNTILANRAPNCNQELASNGYNLEDANSCGLDATGDITDTNPLLGPLVADGDAWVRPLLAKSPAIDHGICVAGITSDQRGMTRPFGDACDIGAYEARFYWVYLPLTIR